MSTPAELIEQVIQGDTFDEALSSVEKGNLSLAKDIAKQYKGTLHKKSGFKVTFRFKDKKSADGFAGDSGDEGLDIAGESVFSKTPKGKPKQDFPTVTVDLRSA